jgi:hypothetical protein
MPRWADTQDHQSRRGEWGGSEQNRNSKFEFAHISAGVGVSHSCASAQFSFSSGHPQRAYSQAGLYVGEKVGIDRAFLPEGVVPYGKHRWVGGCGDFSVCVCTKGFGVDLIIILQYSWQRLEPTACNHCGITRAKA